MNLERENDIRANLDPGFKETLAEQKERHRQQELERMHEELNGTKKRMKSGRGSRATNRTKRRKR